jgi:hypothetical protein
MTCWLVLLLLAVLLWAMWTRQYGQHHQDRTIVTATVQRLLKPRTPDDCPICRQPAAVPSPTIPTHRPVPPWRERKSRRGAPKRIVTQGFACPNRMCIYYGVTDAQIHAPLWRRRRRTARTHPDIPISGLWHHLQRPARYPALLPENPIAAGR